MKNNSSIFVIVISLFIIIFIIISYFILSDSLFDNLKDREYNNSDPYNNTLPPINSSPIKKAQVFHLRDNIFKYEDAKAA